MTIEKDTVKYVARLARISLASEEEALFTRQLRDILIYVEKLKALNTENVEPMSHARSTGNVFREDKIRESLPVAKALENAPEKKEGFFKVPKVIE